MGEVPLTAPESEAVYAFTRSHDFRLILAYHTQGEVIYWKYLDYEPARSYEIAQYFGRVSGYTVEQTPTQSDMPGIRTGLSRNTTDRATRSRPGWEKIRFPCRISRVSTGTTPEFCWAE